MVFKLFDSLIIFVWAQLNFAFTYMKTYKFSICTTSSMWTLLQFSWIGSHGQAGNLAGLWWMRAQFSSYFTSIPILRCPFQRPKKHIDALADSTYVSLDEDHEVLGVTSRFWKWWLSVRNRIPSDNISSVSSDVILRSWTILGKPRSFLFYFLFLNQLWVHQVLRKWVVEIFFKSDAQPLISVSEDLLS